MEYLTNFHSMGMGRIDDDQPRSPRDPNGRKVPEKWDEFGLPVDPPYPPVVVDWPPREPEPMLDVR